MFLTFCQICMTISTVQKIIRYHVLPNGKSPFKEWLGEIKDVTTRLRIDRRLRYVACGLYGDYKMIGAGLYELRLNFGPGYRIYFMEQPDCVVVLLCGGDKSTQNRDINLAKEYLADLKGK
jgi:putative addiction module killer protein